MKYPMTEEDKAKYWWRSLSTDSKRHYAIRSNKIGGAGLSSFNPDTLNDHQIMAVYKDTHK